MSERERDVNEREGRRVSGEDRQTDRERERARERASG